MSLRLTISSSVSGGPMDRLAQHLRTLGAEAQVQSRFTPERYRVLMTSKTGRLFARTAAFLEFPLRAAAHAIRQNAVLVPTTNPFILPFFLTLTRPLHGRRVVALVYDLYPDALEAAGAEVSGIGELVAMSNRWWFSRADAVVFIGRRLAEHAIARYGMPQRYEIIETGADTKELDPKRLGGAPASELESWMGERNVLSYVGNLGHVHDWETIERVIPDFSDRSDTALVVAASGPGAEQWKRSWEQLSQRFVRFVPPLSDLEWARLLVRSSISLVSLREEAKSTCVPSKALSAMAAGSAILAIAPTDSDLAQIVTTHDCGRVVSPGDINGLRRNLTELLDNPEELVRLRANARHAAITHFDVHELASRWMELLGEVAQAK